MPHPPLMLSPMTNEIFSYIAHDKHLPEEIRDPRCGPPVRLGGKLCGHTYAYMLSQDRNELFSRVGAVRKALFKRGGWLVHQRDGFFNLTATRCPMETRFYSSRADVLDQMCLWTSDPDWDHRHVQPLWCKYRRETKEIMLRDFLNELGRREGLRVKNTGLCTINKHINDLESMALDRIVERAAPEFTQIVKKFNDNAAISYRQLGVLGGGEDRYYACRTPRRPEIHELDRYISLDVSPLGGHQRWISYPLDR